MKKPSRKKGKFYRPMIGWPYQRQRGDFQSHLEDLWFWSFIAVQPFRQIFTDPYTGMLNIEHKNAITAIRRRRWQKKPGMFSRGRPYYRSHGRTPQQIELIRYKAALNRPD